MVLAVAFVSYRDTAISAYKNVLAIIVLKLTYAVITFRYLVGVLTLITRREDEED